MRQETVEALRVVAMITTGPQGAVRKHMIWSLQECRKARMPRFEAQIIRRLL
jgi:hypothetical protein